MARVGMVLLNDYVSDSRVRREAEALIARGDSVDCICLSRIKCAEMAGVRLFYCGAKKYRGLNRISLLLRYVQFFCYAFLKVSIEHLRHPYDIVQVHTMPDFLIYTAIVPKLLGAKLILDIHDLMPELYIAKYGPTRGKWIVALITWIERRSVAFADRAIAVHKPHLDILVEHGNPRDKFSVLLNVPDHRIFTWKPRLVDQRTEFRLLYHGTIPERAGLDVALRAVAQVRTEIPHIRFEIVGRGDAVERILTLAKELDIEDCVSLRSSVAVEDLPEIIEQANVGVVPYRSDAFTRWVLPTKLMEYVAMGLPSIVSRLPTVEAYFDRTMVAYFEAGDANGLAEQILRLYRQPEIARQYVAHAARFTETYNWPQQRQLYYGLIDSLLESGQSLVNANSKG